MKNPKKIRLIGGIAALAVILCIAAAVIFTFSKGEDAYRDISVFDLSASASVTRDGKALDAYSGMKLMNGDKIKVGDEGSLCLLLDGDKYVTLETGTEICLNATGDEKNSKTKIELLQGAVLNELDSKLNEDSSYELSTPVSVMAVRGTVFRASFSKDGDASASSLMVFDGRVAAAAVQADGTVSPEIQVDAGDAAHFDKPDANSDPVYSPAEISYEDLPADTLAALLKIYESGRLTNLSISKDDLNTLYQQKKADSSKDAPDDTSSSGQTDDSDADAANSGSGSGGSDDTDDSVNTDTADDSGDSDDSAQPSGDGSSISSSDSSTGSGTGTGSRTGTKADKKSGKSASKSNKSGKPKATAKPGKSNKPKATAKPSGLTATPNPNPVPGTVPTGQPSVNPPATLAPGHTAYTVTFMDNHGNVFGTQSITSGSRVQRPKLSPADGSNWYDAQGNLFDFNTTVTGDLTLYYR